MSTCEIKENIMYLPNHINKGVNWNNKWGNIRTDFLHYKD